MSLSLRGIDAWHGDAQALWGVDLEVPRGEVVGVLGRNGAGKTTLLRCIAGLHRRLAGTVEADGASLAGLLPEMIARRGVALVREGARLPASLSVRENLQLGQRLARLRGKPGRSLDDAWHWFPILEPLCERKAGLLSGGQRQALALATAFVSEPSVLLLDEPSAGLAPPVARELFAAIRRLAASGLTVLLVEQQPAWLEGLAHECFLLEVGRVVARGDVTSLIRNAADRLQ